MCVKGTYIGPSYVDSIVNAMGIGPQGIGSVGMLINFGVTLGLTPLFPPPSEKVRRLVDSIREPEGVGPAVDIEAAIDH